MIQPWQWTILHADLGTSEIAVPPIYISIGRCSPPTTALGVASSRLSLHGPTALPQLEEELQDDLKWSMLTKDILHAGKSKFQDVELIETGAFGKVCQASVLVGLVPLYALV